MFSATEFWSLNGTENPGFTLTSSPVPRAPGFFLARQSRLDRVCGNLRPGLQRLC